MRKMFNVENNVDTTITIVYVRCAQAHAYNLYWYCFYENERVINEHDILANVQE